jgi:hypothetical protein
MHIFFSGTGGSNGSMAERYLATANGGKGPCIMLTHDEIYRNVCHATRRFKLIKAARTGKDVDEQFGRVWMHFLDSGAFGLYAREVKQRVFEDLFQEKGLNLQKFQSMSAGERSAFKREQGHLFKQTKVGSYKYYDSVAFWNRVDDYAVFIKNNRVACDYYANLDVIYNPELTWRVQQYLEDKYKLSPIPVIHSCTPLRWVRHYLDLGHEFIALGGFGGSAYISYEEYMTWASKVFEMICPSPKKIPLVRVHGFAMTNFDLISRFPWWSVDSATWAKAASYGHIYVPYKRRGKFVFDEKPMMVAVSSEVSNKTGKYRPTNDKHFTGMTPEVKRLVVEWLELQGIPLGKVDKWGDMMQRGTTSHYSARMEANLKYFEMLETHLPKWPWPFERIVRERASFNIKV